MILFFDDGTQLRGDLLHAMTLRHDLAPIPVTLEADIRGGDSDIARRLSEGRVLRTAAGDALTIVKSCRVASRQAQGERGRVLHRVTALLENVHQAAFVRSRAIIKENASLAGCYRAAGASLKGIDADFQVPRFTCPVGDTPTFHIARIVQEEGGAVRWKAGRLRFVRLSDLFRQKAALTLPDNVSEDVESGFLERHAVPWFFSLDAAGGVVFGNRAKPRAARFSPFKDAARLYNMTRALVHRKTCRIGYAANIGAGDVIEFVGGKPLVVITAAHVYESGTDAGGGANAYTRLWLGSLEQ